MSDPSSTALLDAIEALSLARPFTTASVARALGVAVEPRADLSNAFFEVHVGRGAATSSFAEVELRTPRAADQGGLVLVTLAPSVSLSKREVMDRFGVRPELGVPTPRQPSSAPIYFIYRFAWGDARFGFDRAGDEALRVVVLDATEARP